MENNNSAFDASNGDFMADRQSTPPVGLEYLRNDVHNPKGRPYLYN